MPEWLHITAAVLIWCAALPATASVVVHALTPWRETPVGRHLFWYMLVVAAVLDVNAARIIGHDTVWFATLSIGVFAGTPIVLVWRLWLQVKLRNDDLPDDEEPAPSDHEPAGSS